MSITADSIVNTVRDLIPDPVYSAGVPQPSSDGNLFLAQSLYRWINEAVKLLAKGIGWQVSDWFPIAVVNGQANYPVDQKWHKITDAFKDRFLMTVVDESAILWPMTSSATRSMWCAVHKVLGNIEVTPFPTPAATDPSTTVSDNPLSSSATTINVGSTAGFLSPGGFVQIDSEIIYYNGLTSTSLTGCIRAQAGTTAASHTQNTAVQHMSLWVKGPRAPAEITAATSVIELLPIFIQPIQLYVLAQCRRAENDHQEARALMNDFNMAQKEILSDPSWRNGNGAQIQPYLGTWQNELVFGRIILG